jgi:protein-tyrosine-phosphatase
VDPSLNRRADLHAALADPYRLAIVDELSVSDRSPRDLGERFGMATNLIAHHLNVLEGAELIERIVSTGDRRRRYVRLRRQSLAELASATARPAGSVLFVCTHNSARSQLAAALWTRRTGRRAASAGTHPADRVHPGAVAAAERAGLDLARARPRTLAPGETAEVVITVCDRAHEELDPPPSWRHWSIPDPVEIGSDQAFDEAVTTLDTRICSSLN